MGDGQHNFTKKHTVELENKQKLNLAKALSTELSSLWERYMYIGGDRLETSNEPVLFGVLETNRNYFVIFDNSANLVGLFDQNIMCKVISIYINFKAFFDELIECGKMVDRYIEADNSSRHTEQLNNELQGAFHNFKTRHFEVKKILEETITAINNIKN